MGGKPIKNVNKFIFLGSFTPGSGLDVDRRIGLVSSAFGRLKRTIFSNKKISIKVKVRLYRALILPIAISAPETWTFTTTEESA